MKFILTFLFSFVFLVSGFSQTRNVVVGTNDVIVQPTNFWSANASNGRTGLGLGSAATNPASAFQPASTVLSNLASSNAVNLTNLRATNIIGVIPSSNIPTINLTNIDGTLAISSGGTGATNAAGARTNLGLGATWLTNTNVTNFRTAIGLGASWLTNNNVTNFRTEIGLGATNDVEFNSVSINELRWEGGLIFEPETGTFQFPINFSTNNNGAAITRANLGLGWSALTNSNAGTGLVSVDTNGVVVSPTNFWQVAPIQTVVQSALSTGATNNITNNATNARNLYIYSLATNTINTTNTIILPTNTSTFAGDNATIIHQGPTSSVTAVRQDGAGSNLITINRFDESVKFIYENNSWTTYHNISFQEPIYFSGTNASANAATSRTNLGLGATWLTNTNVTNFRTAIDVPIESGSGLGSVNIAPLGLNTASGQSSIVLGGTLNQASGNFSVAAGFDSFATQTGSFSFGGGARAVHGGTFVWSSWSEGNTEQFSSTNTNSFNVRALGGMSLDLGTNGIIFRTNASANATRTNLGLGATNNVTFNNVTASGTLTATSTVTAKTNLVVEGHLDFTTNATNSNPLTNNQINDFIEIRVGTNQFWLPVYK